jgi:class 3 adenylate cyclase
MSPEIGDLHGGAPASGRGGSARAVSLEVTPIVAETVRATVLFVDLRGYTGLAERLAPAEVAAMLDEFFGVLAAATERHEGQIFYMVGDGMMAGFGLRSSAASGAQNALAASQAMLEGFAPIVARWRRELSIETGIGVGLHFGDVARCLHGPPGQRAHTLVGDTVNVAARLCSRARAGEVLFSAAVAAALQSDRVADEHASELKPCIRLPQFSLRGRSRPLDIWCMPAPQRLAL